jgi:DNA-binding NarL/FixJ family response regulator
VGAPSVPSPWSSEVEALAQNLASLQRALGSAAHDLRQLQGAYDRLLRLAAGEGAWSDGASVQRLTVQERRVAMLVGLGQRDRQVAQQLRVSVHTVKSHVKSILRKLGLRSRWQLAALTRGAGLGVSEISAWHAPSLGE